MPEVQKFAPDAIAVPPKRRAVDPAAVDRLVESIRAIGLRTPITVRLVDDFVDTDGVIVDGQPVLVTGAHRLEAAKRLGLEKIECYVFETDDDIEARRWEIAENLHRAELTVLERDQHVAEWIRLTEEADVSRQLDEKPKSGPKGGRPRSGVSKAADEIGVSEPDARRAVKVSSLTEDAKETAREVGLDNNRSALLKAAKAQEEGKDASEVLRQIAERKSEARRQSRSAAVLADEKRHRLEAPFSDEEIERLRELEIDDIRNVLSKMYELGWAAARRALFAAGVPA